MVFFLSLCYKSLSMIKPNVTASELGNYVYCECCWADKLEGISQETEEMSLGTATHERLHWQYSIIQFLRQLAIVVVIGSLILLLLFAVIYFLSGNTL